MLYRSSYDSCALRGKDDPLTPRPWNMVNILREHATKNMKLLDLGAGTGFKILPLQKNYSEITCLDISKSMVDAARQNLPFENISIIQGDNFNLPFKENSFDHIISSLSIWDISEIHRVLKEDGIILIELLGCEDKKDFKLFFGNDTNGVRGQHLQRFPETFLQDVYDRFSLYFNFIEIQNGFWDTYYSPKGILKLLSNTPSIRGYSYKKDKQFVKTAIKELSTTNGIKIRQNRILLYAKDPK